MALPLNLMNPAAQGRLADAELTAGFDVAVVLLEHEVSSLALEFSKKGTALFGRLTPRSGEHSRLSLNGCPASLDHYTATSAEVRRRGGWIFDSPANSLMTCLRIRSP